MRQQEKSSSGFSFVISASITCTNELIHTQHSHDTTVVLKQFFVKDPTVLLRTFDAFNIVFAILKICLIFQPHLPECMFLQCTTNLKQRLHSKRDIMAPFTLVIPSVSFIGCNLRHFHLCLATYMLIFARSQRFDCLYGL